MTLNNPARKFLHINLATIRKQKTCILNCHKFMSSEISSGTGHEKEVIQELLEEGFDSVYAWGDSPGSIHPEHEHPFMSTHVILEGQITVFTDGEERIYRAEDRFDIPARKMHWAKIGPRGCKYVIGEKY